MSAFRIEEQRATARHTHKQALRPQFTRLGDDAVDSVPVKPSDKLKASRSHCCAVNHPYVVDQNIYDPHTHADIHRHNTRRGVCHQIRFPLKRATRALPHIALHYLVIPPRITLCENFNRIVFVCARDCILPQTIYTHTHYPYLIVSSSIVPNPNHTQRLLPGNILRKVRNT